MSPLCGVFLRVSNLHIKRPFLAALWASEYAGCERSCFKSLSSEYRTAMYAHMDMNELAGINP